MGSAEGSRNDPLGLPRRRREGSTFLPKKITIFAVALALGGALLLSPISPNIQGIPPTPYLSTSDIAYGRQQCARNEERPKVDYDLASKRLSAPLTGPKTIIRNATLINGDGDQTKEVDIEMRGNIFLTIANASDALSCAEDDIVLNVDGRYVTPGLVDMHSHAGVREEPQLWATEDVTEISQPLTPWGRAVDGIKPHDKEIQVIASGGVTTSLVLTGAKNEISGEGAVIKMKRTNSMPDLLFNLMEGDTNGKPQRYLKMAMGENQKRQFQGSLTGPYTRIGESYWFRHAYDTATQLKQKQDRWCELASTSNGVRALTEPYPRSLEWQTLVDVLRGDVRVNVHGYETEDVFAMLDHADEFNFNITAFHHALRSDLIAKELKKRDVVIVAFSDSWGDKKESYDVHSDMLRNIAKYDIPIALTRDHPAEHGQWLAYEVQIGHHFGLPEDLAIKAMLGQPAKTLGLDNRIGYVRPGYDADLVVWNKHPLSVGATPLQVFIDGVSTVNASKSVWKESEALLSYQPAPPSRVEVVNDAAVCASGQSDVVIRGIKKSFLQDGGLRGEELIGENITAVVREGRLVCVGQASCEANVKEAEVDGVPIMDLQHGHLLPGLTIVTRQHGLTEMRQEPSTGDGESLGDNWSKPFSSALGIRYDGIHLERTHRSGITRLITPPLSEGFFHGLSACFRAGAKNVLDDGAIVDSQVAVHFTIGHDAKQPATPSITSQISLLRDLLTSGKHIHPIYEAAAKGELPVVVYAQNNDVIAHLVLLKRETGADIVILGGAESHLVAKELAAADVPVILAPFACEPLYWDSRNCLPGPPLNDHLTANVLLEAGVKVGISNFDDTNNHIRNSIWEASWIAGPQNNSLALDLVSKNIEEILHLPPARDFVLYEGSPFEFGASVAVVFEEGKIQRCWPGPDEERSWDGMQ